MTTHTHSPKCTRPPLSRTDRVILGLHGFAATGLAIAGIMGSTDPDWADLQRSIVLFLYAVWVGGIALKGVIARCTMSSRWGRLGLLTAGPFIGLALLAGRGFLS
jgi:hypothetical protein